MQAKIIYNLYVQESEAFIMAEDKSTEKELEIIDDKEYQRALDTLNSSKSSRVKKIKDSKKVSKSKKKGKKDAGFDPVIPICLILAVVVFIGSLLYFILPVAANPAMDMTYEQFTDKYRNTEMYQNLFNSFEMNIDNVTYITNNSETGENLSFKITDNNHYLDSFEKLVNAHFGAAIQGQSRKFDGKLTFLRAIAEYDDRVNNYSFMAFYFAGILDAIYNDKNAEDSYNMATTALNNFDKAGTYTVYGDYAYRVVYGADQENGVAYFALEIKPAKAVS